MEIVNIAPEDWINNLPVGTLLRLWNNPEYKSYAVRVGNYADGWYYYDHDELHSDAAHSIGLIRENNFIEVIDNKETKETAIELFHGLHDDNLYEGNNIQYITRDELYDDY